MAVLPSVVLGLLLDDWLDAHLYNHVVVAIMLIVYGVAFVAVEQYNGTRRPAIRSTNQITYQTALLVGCFQVLAMIPGTSRSGATILGAILLGMSRTVGAEFSFFLAIPTMVGASGLKILKFILKGATMSGSEWACLIVASVVAFVVSLLVIRFLMDYIRKHDFTGFGWYRIILGIVVIAYFAISGAAVL